MQRRYTVSAEEIDKHYSEGGDDPRYAGFAEEMNEVLDNSESFRDMVTVVANEIILAARKVAEDLSEANVTNYSEVLSASLSLAFSEGVSTGIAIEKESPRTTWHGGDDETE